MSGGKHLKKKEKKKKEKKKKEKKKKEKKKKEKIAAVEQREETTGSKQRDLGNATQEEEKTDPGCREAAVNNVCQGEKNAVEGQKSATDTEQGNRASTDKLLDKICKKKTVVVVVFAAIAALADLFGNSGWPLMIAYWNNHFAKPQISYDSESEDGIDTFQLHTDFTGTSMILCPQIVVRYDNYVLLTIMLEGYYEEKCVTFSGREATAKKINQARLDSLLGTIKQTILEKVQEQQGDKASEKAGRHLYVYPSLLGGLQYMNLSGNTRLRRCIIEKDKLIVTFTSDSTVVKKRMYAAAIDLGQDLSVSAGTVQELASAVAEKIGHHPLTVVGHLVKGFFIMLLLVAVLPVILIFVISKVLPYLSHFVKLKSGYTKFFKWLQSVFIPPKRRVVFCFLLTLVCLGFPTRKALGYQCTSDEDYIYTDEIGKAVPSGGTFFAEGTGDQPKAANHALGGIIRLRSRSVLGRAFTAVAYPPGVSGAAPNEGTAGGVYEGAVTGLPERQ